MSAEFIIQKGTIIFEEDKIRINDRVYRRDRYITLALALTAVAYGVMTLIHYLGTGGDSDFSFILFGVIVAAGVPAIIYKLRLNYSPELRFDEIWRVIIKENAFGMLTADFLMIKGRKRHVVLDMNHGCNFERYAMSDFIEALKVKGIDTFLR